MTTDTKHTPGPRPVVSYKGFDKNLQCRGFQFEVGKTYTADGTIVACGNGFHACADPLDVWNFYPPVTADGEINRFAVVTQTGAMSRNGDGSKIASASITIDRELSLHEFVNHAVDFIVDLTKSVDSSGDYAANASSGDYAANASSGDYAKNASSGHYAKNASSGNYATNASSGYCATNASSGDYAKNASSGYYAKNASSGNYATNASSGDYAKNASSGNLGKNSASGANCVIMSAGIGTWNKGPIGTRIGAAEYDDSGNCIGIVVGCVGEDGIEPDVWYVARGGKLSKAEG